MVDIAKIQADIEALKNLNAEDYCKPQVEQIYADFESSRAKQISDLERALEIFSAYQVVLPDPETIDETTE